MSKQRYVAKFNKNIYLDFKKLAKSKNKSLNHYLNRKIKELRYDIPMKRCEEDENYCSKSIYLEDSNHKLAKNIFYIKGITIRDYVQAVMEESLKREI
jgi:hypothetical protein